VAAKAAPQQPSRLINRARGDPANESKGRSGAEFADDVFGFCFWYFGLDGGLPKAHVSVMRQQVCDSYSLVIAPYGFGLHGKPVASQAFEHASALESEGDDLTWFPVFICQNVSAAAAQVRNLILARGVVIPMNRNEGG
jgi:hypothetical protein